MVYLLLTTRLQASVSGLQLLHKLHMSTAQDLHASLQVRTKQEEVDHKEEVLAVLMERYASATDALNAKSHLNLGLLGLARQPSVSAPSKLSLAADTKAQSNRQAQSDIKRLGSSRGRLDIKVRVLLQLKDSVFQSLLLALAAQADANHSVMLACRTGQAIERSTRLMLRLNGMQQ